MKKNLVALALVVLALLLATAPAFAGWTWCQVDPNIKLPGGDGVFHIIVAVPVEYRDASVNLDVWAPAGSKVVGNTKNVNVFLHNGPAGEVKAEVSADFPVQLSAKYKGDKLASFVFEDGDGTASWTW